MIKHILTSILCLATLISFSQEKIKVVSSASIFQDMAKNIGGDKITSMSIVPIGRDPHTYTPKPSDVELVSSADLILINGLTFEGWITELIENSGTKAKIILISEGVEPIISQKYHNASDPHAWMDAINGVKYVYNISAGLASIDPDNALFYADNGVKYNAEIKNAHNYIKNQIATIPTEQRILITSHDAFQYYGRAYDITLNAIMGISTESEAQSKDVQRVINVIKEKKVPAVFIESTINPQTLQQIANDTGVKIGGELYADSLGDEDSEASTYLKLLTHNTDVIVNALTGTSIKSTKIDSDDTSNNLWIYVGLGAMMLLSLLFLVVKINN